MKARLFGALVSRADSVNRTRSRLSLATVFQQSPWKWTLLVGACLVCSSAVVVRAGEPVPRSGIGPAANSMVVDDDSKKNGPFRFLDFGTPIHLDELEQLARKALPQWVGRVEEYVVIEGTVLSSTLVSRRPDLRPRLFPYGSYTIAVTRVIGIGADVALTPELEVVAMWPPMYKNGGVGGTYSSHGGDLRVPLSTGLRVLAIGFRSPQGSGGIDYHPELWPLFHMVFAAVASNSDDWYIITPDPGRQFDVGIAQETGGGEPVPLQAWHGEARPIPASADSIFQILEEVAREASER